MDKKGLMKQLQGDWQKYWQLDFFTKNGWKRYECKNCGKFFWSLEKQEVCNDSSCKPREFLERKIMNKSYDYFQAWDAIRKFFEKNGHHYLERYPTVCTWFPLYFTIAGVVDFYRMDRDKFVFEFPKTPVILLQPSIRFNDTENVGKTGVHWTCHGHIEQAGTSYWKEKAIELDFKLLTEVFGIDPKEINFIEDVWLGAGAFGYSLEYHVAGVELGNCVFTEFSGAPDDYVKLNPPVIDMGAGIERFCWMSQQTPTSYEAVLGLTLEKIIKRSGVEYDKNLMLKYSKLSGKLNADEVADVDLERKKIAKELKLDINDLKDKIEPVQAVYALADHARTICFTITDGGVPSNIAGGYNLRVLLRRSFEFIERYKFDFDFGWICEEIAKYFEPINPELIKNIDAIKKVVKIEHTKYEESKERMKSLLKSIDHIDENKMIELYDSHGITPEMLKSVNPDIEIPSDFYRKITEKHMRAAPVKHEVCESTLSKTDKTMIYKKIYEFDAKVLDVSDEKVVLDKTAFYPTGGGQEFDKGTINGCKIYNVQECNGVAVHYVEKPNFKKEDTVKCIVDKKARVQILKHHTGAHLVNLACQKVLGPHIWQEGSKKDIDKAHLDISHYDIITENERI
ncbi:MAG: alanine--tRNA ligase, partial [Nanoarchaeota archaeon]|nr:alanine--tRNA ligase [Nanoarchaeota archaeon]